MKTKFSGILTLFLAFVVQLSFAQEKTVSGTISDENGLPLPGVNIIVKGTSSGTQTDFDGNYSISAKTGDVLTYSFVGYKDAMKTVSGSKTISFAMDVDVSAIDEVVIVAYGTEKAKNTTSAISSIKSESIEQVPNASLDQLLQGQSAGLNIQTSSGQPGSSATVMLRGRTTLSGEVVEPLYIMDGVPVDEDNFRSLNSNDIANISILKDASASALYGNRAAGGVIIVTTKKGKKGSGTKFTYRSLYGQAVNSDPNFKVMNSRQYLNFQKDNGFGFGSGLSDNEINAIANQADTNWADIFFQTGTTNSHEINMTTGSENTSSFNSIGYFEQEGTTLRSGLKRFTFRSNLSTNLNEKLTFASNLTANYSESNLANAPGSGSLDNPFLTPYIAQPFVSPYNPDGSLNIYGTDYTTGNGGNTNGFLNTPFLALNTAALNSELEQEVRVVGNLSASLKLTEDLTAGTNFGLDYIQENFKNLTVPSSLRGEITPDTNALVKGSQFEGMQRDVKFNFTNYLTYAKSINDVHNFEVSGFVEFWKRHYNYFGYTAYGVDPKLIGSGSGFTDGTVEENETLYYVPNVGSNSFEDSLFSYFGVAKYNYDDKYNFQASIRRDATARFSETNKWGTFWSVSGSWNLDQEKFLENSETVNSLKLRASYGTVGNAGLNNNTIGRFQALTIVNAGTGYNNSNGYYTGTIGNPDLKWETTKQANIGIDFSLLNYKLTGSLDVYDKLTEDLLYNSPLAYSVAGTGSIDANIGSVSNKGVELGLKYHILDKNDLKWSVSVNAAYNKNEVVELGPNFDGDPILNGGGTALQIGQPITSFYRVRWAGVNPADGTPLYLDANGDLTGTYNTSNNVFSDRTQDPLYTGGFGTDLSYKNLSLNVLFAFAAEQYRLNGSYALIEDTSLASFANMSTALLNAWEEPGDITDIPVNNGTSYRGVAGDRYLEDASFLRLRNVSIAYSLDKKLLERTKFFTGIRMFLQGQNLFTWSKWRGFDPESDIASTFFEYPTPKTVTLGFDIEF